MSFPRDIKQVNHKFFRNEMIELEVMTLCMFAAQFIMQDEVNPRDQSVGNIKTNFDGQTV